MREGITKEYEEAFEGDGYNTLTAILVMVSRCIHMLKLSNHTLSTCSIYYVNHTSNTRRGRVEGRDS